MVKRCGFFLQDGVLMRKDVMIEWDLGFDREAKLQYIDRLHSALGEELSPIVEVTTASNTYVGRCLSPFYTKIKGVSVEDLWPAVKEKANGVVIPGMYEFVYLQSLTDEQQSYVLQRKCFTDVFFNPDKAYSTQAKALVVYQLLCLQEKKGILGSLVEFTRWYEINGKEKILN